MNIEGTSALVTGAASGLGAATAAGLAQAGAAVLGLDLQRSIDGLAVAPPAGVQLVAADVTDAEQVRSAIAGFAPGPIRVAVNCAGIAPAQRVLGSKGPHDLDLFRRTIEVNLVGTFNVLRLAAEAIATSDPDDDGQRGVIVNTASIAAFEAQIGQAAYAASKGGVVSLTLAAARDLARHGIRVVTIAPGIVDTPMLAAFGPETNEALAAGVPFPHRLARPEEFARLVTMAIEHDYLNGATIRMDGALRMEA